MLELLPLLAGMSFTAPAEPCALAPDAVVRPTAVGVESLRRSGVSSIELGGEPRALACSRDARWVVVAIATGKNRSTLIALQPDQEHGLVEVRRWQIKAEVRSLAIARDRLMAIGRVGGENQLGFYDLAEAATRDPHAEFQTFPAGDSRVAVAPDGSLFLAACGNQIRSYTVENGATRQVYQFDQPLRAWDLQAGIPWILVALEDSVVAVDLRDGAQRGTLPERWRAAFPAPVDAVYWAAADGSQAIVEAGGQRELVATNPEPDTRSRETVWVKSPVLLGSAVVDATAPAIVDLELEAKSARGWSAPRFDSLPPAAPVDRAAVSSASNEKRSSSRAEREPEATAPTKSTPPSPDVKKAPPIASAPAAHEPTAREIPTPPASSPPVSDPQAAVAAAPPQPPAHGSPLSVRSAAPVPPAKEPVQPPAKPEIVAPPPVAEAPPVRAPEPSPTPATPTSIAVPATGLYGVITGQHQLAGEVVLLGPNDLLHEQARSSVIHEAGQARFLVPALPNGRYRLLLMGVQGRALLTRPGFATVTFDGTAALRVDFDVVGPL